MLKSSCILGDKSKSKDEKVKKRLPTLSEVSYLFEEFYDFAKHYSWINNEDKTKKTFMKLLEKFATKNIGIVDVKKVRNFLQSEIFIISNGANEASIDYDIFHRYNFIVSDLIERKSSINSNVDHQRVTTISPSDKTSAVTNSYNKLTFFEVTGTRATTTTTTRRPLVWKPGKTPNSLEWKNVRLIHIIYVST